MRCSQVISFTSFHSNKQVVSIGHACHIKSLVAASIVVLIVKNAQPIRPKPPVRIYIPSTASDVTSFNGQVFVS